MKKSLLSLLLVLALSLSLCAFAETPVTDRAGNPVTLPADPQKVVCLNSAACQTLETLGLLDRLVAVDTYSPMYVSGLDSLPQFDMMNPDIEQIAGLEPDLVIITGMSGISGDNSQMLLARWERDVRALDPQWVSICIGINDVWRQFDSPAIKEQTISPEEYRENVRKMILTEKPHVKGIFLMTPYYMEPNASDFMRARMDEYGAIVKRLAKEYSLPCIDLQPVFSEYLANRHSAYLMWDRVHPGPIGSMLIAGKILKEFGFDKNITE